MGRAVHELVGAVLPAQEAHNVALTQLAPAGGRAQAELALEQHNQLLLAEVVVIGIGRLPGGYLPQAQSESLRAGLAAQAGAPRAKPRVLAQVVEVRLIEVGHRPQLMAT